MLNIGISIGAIVAVNLHDNHIISHSIVLYKVSFCCSCKFTWKSHHFTFKFYSVTKTMEIII